MSKVNPGWNIENGLPHFREVLGWSEKQGFVIGREFPESWEVTHWCFLPSRPTPKKSGAGEHISQQAHVVRPLESGMLAGHDGPNAVLGTST